MWQGAGSVTATVWGHVSWAGHSPGVDSEDLADEEGSILRDVGVQLEGIKAPCQDTVLCLDGVHFEEW